MGGRSVLFAVVAISAGVVANDTMAEASYQAQLWLRADLPVVLQAWWAEENQRCRGSAKDAVERCVVREAYSEKLHALGWCYGKRGQATFQDLAPLWSRLAPVTARC